LLDLLRELNRVYGLTTVIVTHDPQIARQVDRVVAIRDGRTSTETIRRVGQPCTERSERVERAIAGERQKGEPEVSEEAVDYHEYVVLDSAGRLQVPGEYLEQFGIGDRATLEVTGEGILIRPADGRAVATPPPSGEVEEEEPPAPRRRGLRAWWARRRTG
jgi:energy-coupling factor transporter ATP-binding protein EcfA2